jgi:hypothetical protein
MQNTLSGTTTLKKKPLLQIIAYFEIIKKQCFLMVYMSLSPFYPLSFSATFLWPIRIGQIKTEARL